MTNIITKATGRYYDAPQILEVIDLHNGTAAFRDLSRNIKGVATILGIADVWRETMTAYDFGEYTNMDDKTEALFPKVDNKTMKVEHFETSGDAYNASQTSEVLKNGDLLVVKSESAVALCGTWPVAVTVAHGEFHRVIPGHVEAIASDMNVPVSRFRAAVKLARDLGFEIDPAFANY